MFALSIFFLFFYHIYLTLTNQSTIESFHPPYFPHGPDRRGYRLSYKENWKQVFGPDPKHWFLPTFSRFVVVVVVFLSMLTPCLLFFLCLAPSMDWHFQVVTDLPQLVPVNRENMVQIEAIAMIRQISLTFTIHQCNLSRVKVPILWSRLILIPTVLWSIPTLVDQIHTEQLINTRSPFPSMSSYWLFFNSLSLSLFLYLSPVTASSFGFKLFYFVDGYSFYETENRQKM